MQQAPLYYNLISLGGLAALVAIARLCGLRRGPTAWRTLAWGLGLQLAMGALVFALPAGRGGLLAVNAALVKLLEFSRAGVHFLFGPLALGPGQQGSLGFILALQALPTIIFFMALTALLYQAGVLQRVVRWFSAVFVRSLGSSGAESLGVASLIFVGVESAGMVRPFLPSFTRSEFFCLLTAAMSTVASSTLGIYVATLHQSFPNIAGHLVSASLISAPAAIVVAKLMEPEIGQPLTAGRTVDPALGKYGGYMEAVITGSNDGVRLLVGIVALLISFLGLVALADGLVGWVGGLLGAPGFSLQTVLGWLGYPLALIMGVPPTDAAQVGALLGQRVLVTEIPAYAQLSQLLAQHGLAYDRSALLASYALCGFAHVASVAIFVGGFGALAPGRLGELSRLGLKALWAATLATVMTGCIAGIFASGGASLLGLGN
ncbi:MAG: nucleoside transporter [Desulfarculus sp.]|nr:MAG: nucleoside transporter [Desulfarculus sp.]